MSLVATFVTFVGAETVGAYVASYFTTASLSSIALAAVGTATIAGASTLIRGGTVGQAFSNAAKGGVASYIGGTIGKGVSGYVADVAMNLEISPQTSKIIGNVIGGSVGQGSSAALRAAFNGQNALNAFKKTGLTSLALGTVGAGVTAATSSMGLSTTTGDKVQDAFARATNAALVGTLMGQDYAEWFKYSLIASAADAAFKEVTKSDLKTGAEDKLTAAEAALQKATDDLNNATSQYGPVRDTAYTLNIMNGQAGKMVEPYVTNAYNQMLEGAVDDDGNVDGTRVIDNMKSKFGLTPKGPYGQFYMKDYAGNTFIVDFREGADIDKAFKDVISTQAVKDVKTAFPADRYAPGYVNQVVYGPTQTGLDQYNAYAQKIVDAQKQFEQASQEFIDQEAYNAQYVEDKLSPIVEAAVKFQTELGRPLTEAERDKLFDAKDPLAAVNDIIQTAKTPPAPPPAPEPEPVAPPPAPEPEPVVPEPEPVVPEPEPVVPEPEPVVPEPVVPEPEPEPVVPEPEPVVPEPEPVVPEPEPVVPEPVVPEPETPPVPDYGVQDLGITPENLASYDKNLLDMFEQGLLPSQWQLGDDGLFTYTDDDGSTITLGTDGSIIGTTPAPAGNLPGETPPTPQPPAGGGTTTPPKPVTPPPVTPPPVAPPQRGVDLTSLLGLLGMMGGDQQQMQQPQQAVQTPPPEVKSFEEMGYGEIFGDKLQFSDGGSIDDLLKLLRG